MSVPGEEYNDFATSYGKLKLLPRRWFPLWKLDGYILREFLLKYTILLLVFIILFILRDVYQDISDFLEAKSSWREIVTYLLYKLPGNIRFVLPISTLLGCMWTMAAFGKNMEVTAMRASGVSLFRCSCSIFVMGFIVSLVNVYFNEVLVPVTEVQATRLYDQAAKNERYTQSLLSYRSDDQSRRWLFQLFVAGSEQKQVTIKTVWTRPMIEKLIGKEGTPEFEIKLSEIIGKRVDTLPPPGDPKRTDALFALLNGRKIEFSIDCAVYDWKKREWTFLSGHFVSFDRTEENRFTGSRGVSIMHNDLPFNNVVFSHAEIPESPEDITNAVKEKEELSTPVIWRILHSDRQLPKRARCIYETVFFYRIAFPWASFLAVFLGIPLATKNERTGSMLAIISAIVLIVLYIVVAQICLMFGKGGLLDPRIAGLAPTVLFIGAGAWKILTDRN